MLHLLLTVCDPSSLELCIIKWNLPSGTGNPPLRRGEWKGQDWEKKDLCFTCSLDEEWSVLEGCESFPCGCAVEVWVMIPHKSSSNAAESCGDHAGGRWPSLDSSELSRVCQNVSHVYISLPAAGENWFLSVFSKSLLCLTKKKFSNKVAYLLWTLLSFLPFFQAALSWTKPSSI